jgi:hypothetical protein
MSRAAAAPAKRGWSKMKQTVRRNTPRTGLRKRLIGTLMDRRNWRGKCGEELPTFQIQITRKRARWDWQVGSDGGRPIMYGSEATRARASYVANRALFLLLSTTNLKTVTT